MKKEDELAAEMRVMDREWRQHLMNEVKELRKDIKSIRKGMGKLKLTVALMSSSFGAISAAVLKYFEKGGY